ncbi:MAG TPA: PKD domain-containing protein [Bacteroidia bacterium]|nr:PKD domain-containing protein [Bacteroidia bacterium]
MKFACLLVLSFTRLNAAVVANFSANVTAGCSPLTVNFTDRSTGSPTTWSWNFGNGNASSLVNPSAIYNTPGTYTVTLTVSDGSSSSSKTQVITVFASPVAAFSTTPSSTCAGQVVTFHDGSTLGSAPIATWHWDFGDGNALTTTAGLSTHTYSGPGIFPASLIVTDTNGCSSSIVVQVTVNPVPVPVFTATPVSGCTAPLLVTFSNTSTASASATYTWYFGDGTTSAVSNPTHTYNAAGSYSVKLVITQLGCSDSIVKTNYIVIKNITTNFKADTTVICLGQVINFTDLSAPGSLSRTWNFGDGTNSTLLNPSHTYGTAGTYTVTLQSTDTSGCTGTKVRNNYIKVNANPVAAFTNSAATGCAIPFSVTFTNASTGGTSYSWSFGDGGSSVAQNPVHIYNSAGPFTVKLVVTNANGCKDSISKTNLVQVLIPPAYFMGSIPLRGCIPLTVNFTDTTTTSAFPIATYSWDFGNGTNATTTVPNTSCTYNTGGVFNVKLTITTTTGCVDTLTKIAYVQTGIPPVANFTWTPDTICFGQTIQFTNTSTGANGQKWIYGDGASDNLLNPNHLYGDTGTFSVTLIAMNNGCPDTVTKTNIITVLPPMPNFTYLLSCTNYFTVSFTNTSAKADSVVWDFGDGTFDVSNNNTPTHTYAGLGPETVKITAFNKRTGCSFFLTKTFTIAQPIASFTTNPTPPNGCIPLSVTFTSTSQDANVYSWDLGNGMTSTSSAPATVYSIKGAYSVKLIITDVNGCKDTVTETNLVHAFTINSVNFSGTPQNGCAPLLVAFKDSSFADSALVKWTWTYGDGTPAVSAGPNPTHIYASRGTYNVSLTVMDTNGCTASITKVNYITATKPYPALTVDTFSCKGDILLFDASATTVAAPANYTWSFGDGTNTVTTTNTTTHAYPTDNIYTVTLTVSDANGCDSTITRKVLILQPVASFRDSTLSYGCGTKQIQFISQSTGFVNWYSWSFGNGATSTLQNPIYTYTSPGTYQVKLVVRNLGGCMDSITRDSIVVVPGPIGSFTFHPSTGCVPLTVNFNVTSANATFFTWDFGDGNVIANTTLNALQHIYLHPITVTPIVLMTDTLPNGNLCQLPATNLTGSVTATQYINIGVVPGGVLTISDDQLIGLTTSITGTVSNNLTYSWTPAQGLNCTTCPDPVIDGIGQDMTYYLTVTDLGDGCINSDSIKVKFDICDDKPAVPNVFTPNNDGINDILYVSGLCIRNSYKFEVYDRWGVVMFSTNVRKSGWDGRTLAGQLAQSGVYYYIVTVDDKVYKGFVELMR